MTVLICLTTAFKSTLVIDGWLDKNSSVICCLDCGMLMLVINDCGRFLPIMGETTKKKLGSKLSHSTALKLVTVALKSDPPAVKITSSPTVMPIDVATF